MEAHACLMHSRSVGRLRFALLLTLWITVSSAVSDTFIHCKMKPGCNAVSQCDPIPQRWIENGLKIDDYLFNKEFPIACTNNDLNSLREEFKDLNAEVGKLKLGNRELKISLDAQAKLSQNLNTEVGKLKRGNRELKRSLDAQAKLFQKKSESKQKQNNFNEELKKLNRRMMKLEEIKNLKTEIKNFKLENKPAEESTDGTQHRINENCIIYYKKKCFLPYMDKLVNKTDAEVNCEKQGGKLANIYDKTHMDRIMNVVRAHYMTGKSLISLWLGMTYDHDKGEVFLSNGTVTKYTKWYLGHPYNKQGRNSIILFVDHTSTSPYQYVLDAHPSAQISYALCEI